jgi:hypothetical protein
MTALKYQDKQSKSAEISTVLGQQNSSRLLCEKNSKMFGHVGIFFLGGGDLMKIWLQIFHESQNCMWLL